MSELHLLMIYQSLNPLYLMCGDIWAFNQTKTYSRFNIKLSLFCYVLILHLTNIFCPNKRLWEEIDS